MTATDVVEHIAWAKERALAELDGEHARGYAPEVRVANALSSLQSDLRKHPATEGHSALELGAMLAYCGHLQTEQQVREWIEGVQ